MKRLQNWADDADKYMATAGHFGAKSPVLVKHYTEDWGVPIPFCDQQRRVPRSP